MGQFKKQCFHIQVAGMTDLQLTGVKQEKIEQDREHHARGSLTTIHYAMVAEHT